MPITTEDNTMHPIAHPGKLLKRELAARNLSANRLALAFGVTSGRITDILNGRRSITAETTIRLARYCGNRPRFWFELQGQYNVALVERDRGSEIAKQVRPDGAGKNRCLYQAKFEQCSCKARNYELHSLSWTDKTLKDTLSHRPQWLSLGARHGSSLSLSPAW